MPTAYLSPSLLQDLTNVSVTPGAGNTGYPLVWNNTSGRFELSVLNVAGGGTGITAFGTGVASALGQAVTGLGGIVLANSPTLATPTITGKAVVHSLTVGLGGQTSVSTNTAIGFEALNSATLTGTSNVGVGYRALRLNTSGFLNTAVGGSALASNTTGSFNNAIGLSALGSNIQGDSNNGIGYTTLGNNTTGGNNNAMGFATMLYNTTGAFNNAVGSEALRGNTTGNFNNAIGFSALSFATTGSNNNAVGVGAGRLLSGSQNTLIGNSAGTNISRGVATLGAITGGNGYVDGTYSPVNLTHSSGSLFATPPTATIVVSGGAVTQITLLTTGTGFQSTDTVLTASTASIGGSGTGFTVAVATLSGAVSDANTLIGFNAATNLTQGSNNIVIGANLNAESATGSNQINIGDRYFDNRLRLLERSSDPAKPTEGNMVLWLSNGAGLGDDGDIIIASTAGGVTNYAILFDHSAGTLWP